VASNDFKIKADKFKEDAEYHCMKAAEQIGKIRWATIKADKKVDLLIVNQFNVAPHLALARAMSLF
jgi:hypothetical protein